MAFPVIVYGPRGCGKTRNAEKLRESFGLLHVVDEWNEGEVEDDTLYLTSNIPQREKIPFCARVFSWAAVAKERL